jgi:hypothetical protein
MSETMKEVTRQRATDVRGATGSPRSPQPERAAHTPGPWKVSDDFNSNGDGACASVIADSSEHDYFIAHVWSDFEVEEGECVIDGIPPQGTGLANARLMSASPDLLAALKQLVEAERQFAAETGLQSDDPINDALQVADVAIAKAEGLAFPVVERTQKDTER